MSDNPSTDIQTLREALNVRDYGPLKSHSGWREEAFAALDRLEARVKEQEEALRKGQAFERAYQESLGTTPTTGQWERLESLQSAFLDAYLAVLAEQEKPKEEK